jgi:hypothetical protein
VWVRRTEGETAVGKLNGETGRRAHPRTEFTNKNLIIDIKITVKTTYINVNYN